MKQRVLITVLSLNFLLGLNIPLTHAQEVIQKQISLDQAKQIALGKVKGEIVFAEEENDDGISKYEIIIKGTDGGYEVEVDKATGKVLKVEKEDDDAGYDD